MQTRKNDILDHFDKVAPKRAGWLSRNKYFHKSENKYLQFLIPEGVSVLEVGCGIGDTLASLNAKRAVGIDLSPKMISIAQQRYPELTFIAGDCEDPETWAHFDEKFDYVLINDTLNFLTDIVGFLKLLKPLLTPDSRIVIVHHNHFWSPILKIAELLKMKMPQPIEANYFSNADIDNLCSLANLDTIKFERRYLVPSFALGLGPLINNIFGPLPLIRNLSLRKYVVSRPIMPAPDIPMSATILIPARNEAGNIENAMKRMPKICEDMEIIFIEGNSSDNTWEEMLRVQKEYGKDWNIRTMQQSGKGKGDAVWLGFDEATKDIVMILDSDLAVAPEDLQVFYDAMQDRSAEFAMGTRLVYPMEKDAMRFFNWWGNRAFAMIFSYILNQRMSDTLCGTKVISRENYKILKANKSYFGDFDPFGDFDLIFGASKMNLKIREIPVRYRARVYGEPQISRWSDGLLLLKMVIFAWRKLKIP